MEPSFFSLKNLFAKNGTKPECFWNIPNVITATRIISAVFSTLFLCLGIWPALTYFLKLYEAVSDAADGYAARLLNCATAFGAKFDPVADKIVTASSEIFIILVNSGFLAYLNRPYPQVDVSRLATLLFLDASLLALGYAASKYGLPVKANISGKMKMICECVFINFWFLSYLAPLGIIFAPETAALWSDRLINLSILFAAGSIVLHLAKYVILFLRSGKT